jgi:hypothetical protein
MKNEDISALGIRCFMPGCDAKAVTRQKVQDGILQIFLCLCPACGNLQDKEIIDRLRNSEA